MSPAAATAGAPRGTFASLTQHNYRLFFFGMLVSNTGLWISRVAQDWLVLVILTDHSAVALGIVTALQFAPMVVLGPFAGTLADRVDKRKLLMLTQLLSALLSIGLAIIVLSGNATLLLVYALALAQGTVNALDNPARQAFVSELVPGSLIPNAVGLNSASFHAARLLGPAVGGLSIAAFGVGPSFVINAVSFAGVLLALFLMNTGELLPVPRRKGNGGIREGLAYVRSRPEIMLIMFMAFMLGTFGMNFQVTNALMATQVYGVGPEGYGLLGSVMAIGSLSGALLAARRPQPRFRFLLAALAGFAVFSVLAAMAPSYGMFAALLVPLGLMSLTAMTTANAAVQLATDPGMRGRVLALYMAVFLGGTPIGAPIIGWVGDAFGPRATLLIGAGAVAIAVLVGLIYFARRPGTNLEVRSRLRSVHLPWITPLTRH